MREIREEEVDGLADAAMSELKPCKLCGRKPVEHGGSVWCDGMNALDRVHTPVLCARPNEWNALMDDTPALLRGARIGLAMAAEHMDRQIMALPKEHTISRAELSRARTHFSMRAKIPDADIEKEISREGAA